MKMWVGNLDGSREGLVIAPTKVRARTIIGRTSRSDFDAYWRELEHPVDQRLEPEVLYTRRFGARTEAWFRGKCPLRSPLDPTRKDSDGGHPDHRLALGIDCPEPSCRAPKGQWCPMLEAEWALCGKRIHVARGYDSRGNQVAKEGIRSTMTHPPIANGTRVKATVRRVGKGDYTQDAIKARIQHDGKIGVVSEHHDSHGLCYGVTFEDGAAFFDPEELEIVP